MAGRKKPTSSSELYRTEWLLTWEVGKEQTDPPVYVECMIKLSINQGTCLGKWTWTERAPCLWMSFKEVPSNGGMHPNPTLDIDSLQRELQPLRDEQPISHFIRQSFSPFKVETISDPRLFEMECVMTLTAPPKHRSYIY